MMVDLGFRQEVSDASDNAEALIELLKDVSKLMDEHDETHRRLEVETRRRRDAESQLQALRTQVDNLSRENTRLGGKASADSSDLATELGKAQEQLKVAEAGKVQLGQEVAALWVVKNKHEDELAMLRADNAKLKDEVQRATDRLNAELERHNEFFSLIMETERRHRREATKSLEEESLEEERRHRREAGDQT